jgi:hypothetical protein
MAIMQVPIVKGKGVVEIDTDTLPEAVYAEALLQGLKTLANRGMSKVTIKDLGDEATVRKEAMIIATQNVAKIAAGEIKFSGKASKSEAAKLDKAVGTEALRIARERVRDGLKAAGKKLYAVKASEITSAAKELIGLDPSIVQMAEQAIKARQEVPTSIDLSALIAGVKEDTAKIAKEEAKKAEAKANKPISAKQAGLVKGRKAKPVPVATHTPSGAVHHPAR